MNDSDDRSKTFSGRLISLDAFRGFAIAGMFLVNNPGLYNAVYPPLAHAEWNGWTFADTIFPFFLFVVGVATIISFSRKRDSISEQRLFWLILRRSVSIIALGLVMHAFHSHFSAIRIPGTLQRIGVCYGIAALITIRTSIRGQICLIVGLLASYWLMMEFIPVPGVGAGVYEPGKNFAAYIDSFVFSGHMWPEHPTWDPEGIISTLPAIATTLFGVIAGQWLMSTRPETAKSAWMTGGGLALLLVGSILDRWLPINKSLWTSSYSIFMSGMACCCLGPLHWIVDVRGYKRWTKPLVTMGVNAIALYFLAGVLNKIMMSSVGDGRGQNIEARTFALQGFLRFLSPVNASFFYAFSFLLVMYLVAYVMQKMGWFVRL